LKNLQKKNNWVQKYNKDKSETDRLTFLARPENKGCTSGMEIGMQMDPGS